MAGAIVLLSVVATACGAYGSAPAAPAAAQAPQVYLTKAVETGSAPVAAPTSPASVAPLAATKHGRHAGRHHAGTKISGGQSGPAAKFDIHGPVTFPQWASLLLNEIQAPNCSNNVVTVVAWEAAEKSKAGWNPLGSTVRVAGSTPFHGGPLQNYPSIQQGLLATVVTLWQGLATQGDGPIVVDLQHCAPAATTAAAIRASKWCPGCDGGAYVTGIVAQVEAAYRNAYGRGTPSLPVTLSNAPPPPNQWAAVAIRAAESQLGVPYIYADATPGLGFDCSGLTMWAWGQAGVRLPHNAAMQYAALPHVPRSDLLPGDLLFFYQPIDHVAMYIGNGQMIEAPHTGAFVRIVPVYWDIFVGAARP